MAAPTVVLEQISAPKKQKSTQILPGIAKEAAAALVEKLKIGGARPMSVLLVLEESGGRIKNSSWEALAAAHRLGPAESITAVVIGAQTEALAAEAATQAPSAKSFAWSIRCSRSTRPMVFLRSRNATPKPERYEVRGVFAYLPGARLRRRRWLAAWARF